MFLTILTFVDDINVFDCRLPGVIWIRLALVMPINFIYYTAPLFLSCLHFDCFEFIAAFQSKYTFSIRLENRVDPDQMDSSDAT